jgi:hypothetical protein
MARVTHTYKHCLCINQRMGFLMCKTASILTQLKLLIVCSTAVIGGALIGLTGGMATPAVGKRQKLETIFLCCKVFLDDYCVFFVGKNDDVHLMLLLGFAPCARSFGKYICFVCRKTTDCLLISLEALSLYLCATKALTQFYPCNYSFHVPIRCAYTEHKHAYHTK